MVGDLFVRQAFQGVRRTRLSGAGLKHARLVFGKWCIEHSSQILLLEPNAATHDPPLTKR
jgi:hypothetical protein